MTYKENIKAILECYFTGFKEEIIDNACNRILEQEPCEDAVSRQYLIDIATKDGAYDYVSAQEIANAPSVNPQPKTGHWRHYEGMLTGDKFQTFHKYVEDIMGRPILTHEIGWLADAIKEKSKADFIALCADESLEESCDKCEVGNPCLYCKHEFEERSSEE